jgi:hypothetical protein
VVAAGNPRFGLERTLAISGASGMTGGGGSSGGSIRSTHGSTGQ